MNRQPVNLFFFSDFSFSLVNLYLLQQASLLHEKEINEEKINYINNPSESLLQMFAKNILVLTKVEHISELLRTTTLFFHPVRSEPGYSFH